MNTSEKPGLTNGAAPSNRIFPICFVLAIVLAGIALVWQGRTIVELRADVSNLRKDLHTVLATILENPTASSDGEQARREKLELIKLRNEVRELKENVAASHGTKPAKFGELLNSLLPAPAPGPIKMHPDWQRFESRATNQYAQAMQALRSATSDYVRFLSLHMAAKLSYAVGRTEDARQFATDMMVLDEKYSRGAPEKAHGDILHDGHVILGRIALEEGQLEDAKRHLLAAGKSTGSPVLGSFGPNMGLAKDLLKKGEQEVVLQYFESIRKFWKSDKLDEWSKDIQAGRIPDFGAHLIY